MELTQGTTLQDGKYRIVKVLGTGGFGITYLAQMKTSTQGALGTIDGYTSVAIKEFFMKTCCNRNKNTSEVSASTEVNQDTFGVFRKKFEKEARFIARLRYPGIVPVLEVFQEHNTSYYVMEYISGKSINQLLDEQGTFDVDTALGYINGVGRALAYIHKEKFLHLDIKPDNILVRPTGEPVLIDFGGAKHFSETGDTESTTTPPVHSDGYSPIEVYSGISCFSPESDVYSLAATFYKMITGIRPAKATELGRKPLTFPDSIPMHIRYAITQAMQVLPENRLRSIDEFLGLANGTTPVPAQPDPVRTGGRSTGDEETQYRNPAQSEATQFIPKVNKIIPGQGGNTGTAGTEATQIGQRHTTTTGHGHGGATGLTGNGSAPGTAPKKKSRVLNLVLLAVIALVCGGIGFHLFHKPAGEAGGNAGAGGDATVDTAALIDSLEMSIDTLLFNHFNGPKLFLANLEQCEDSMDGFKVDACEKIYHAYSTADSLCGADKHPSLHCGLKHADIVTMCDRMAYFSDTQSALCTDLGEPQDAELYKRNAATWRQRKASIQ